MRPWPCKWRDWPCWSWDGGITQTAAARARWHTQIRPTTRPTQKMPATDRPV